MVREARRASSGSAAAKGRLGEKTRLLLNDRGPDNKGQGEDRGPPCFVFFPLYQEPQVKEFWLKEDFFLVKKEQVGEHFKKLSVHKLMDPDRMHPRMLRELTDAIVRPLFINIASLWQLAGVSEDWKGENVNPVFKKGMNHRLISLTSVHGKVMDQIT